MPFAPRHRPITSIVAAPRGPEVNLKIPFKYIPMLQPNRYKIYYGGRGGAKSWSFARIALMKAMERPRLILCAREFQNSIADSVHRLLSAQIAKMGLKEYFGIGKQSIRCHYTGSQFIFKGLAHSIGEIKSTEDVDILWVEEAQATSRDSWKAVIPTIRKPDSEIWVSFNPDQPDDPTYEEMVLRPPPDALVQKVNWYDNPWLSEELDKERRHCLATDQDAYDWIWEGECRKISEAMIFKGRFSIEAFDEPEDIDRIFLGADWGFANDPSVLVRFYVRDDCLWITHEAYAAGVEIDDLPALFEGGIAKKTGTEFQGVPGAKYWPIKADSARPETISYIRRRGFNIDGAEKWKGCVEDGIAHLKGFRKIIIHPRCIHVAQEARLYSYKVDKKSNSILPKIVDKHNHTWDAIRYGLDGYIQSRGGLGVWEKLAG